MTQVGKPIEGPDAWRGEELQGREDWRIQLQDADQVELDAAVAANRSRPLAEVDRNAFALPTLEPRLRAVQESLEHGCGAVWLRGLDLEGRDEDELARLFWGIASHIGTAVSQSVSGDRLLHVRDERFGEGDPRVRGPHTNKRLSFHTDRCDVIAFLCVQQARSGGDNHLLSSAALFNELLARHPDALRVLQGTFPYLRHTVDGGNQRPFTEVPVFTVNQGHFAASFLRVLIDRADRSPDAPDLSAAQRQALDLLEEVAEDPGLYTSFRLEAGDILLLNNWVTFHRRTAFEDHPEPERRRHLMRLWLSVPNSRPLDPRFAEHFGDTAAGALRGGMRPRGT